MNKKALSPEEQARVEAEFLRRERKRDQVEKENDRKKAIIDVFGNLVILILLYPLGLSIFWVISPATQGGWIFTFIVVLLLVTGLAVVRRKIANRLKERLKAEQDTGGNAI